MLNWQCESTISQVTLPHFVHKGWKSLLIIPPFNIVFDAELNSHLDDKSFSLVTDKFTNSLF